MDKLCERLKNARKSLSLSQEYVANVMGVNRNVITSIESGTRKVSTDEISFFSELYGFTTDELINGPVIDEEREVKMLARAFKDLTERDKKEILNLIEFKRSLKDESRIDG